RPPAPEHLAELKARFAAIGNRFPLLEITMQQALGLERELNAAGSGAFKSYLGMKHSPPFVADAVEEMRRDGIRRAVGIVMAPHWSAMSTDTYLERALGAAAEGGPVFTFVRSFHDHPQFIELLALRVAHALGRLPGPARERAMVIFSAHSLPVRTEADGSLRCLRCERCVDSCRYRDGLQETADLVAERLDLEAHTIAWQSAGRTAARGGHPRAARRWSPWGGGVLGGVRGGPPRDPLRPRHRGSTERGGGGSRVRADRDAERRSSARPHARERGARASRGGDRALSARVVVVGGGVAGLATAYRLLRPGRDAPGAGDVDLVVLEAEASAGGKVRSVELAGTRVEAGPDSLLARKPAGVELCRELGLGAELEAPATGATMVWTDRGLLPFPSGPFGITTDLGELWRWPGMSWRGKLR